MTQHFAVTEQDLWYIHTAGSLLILGKFGKGIGLSDSTLSNSTRAPQLLKIPRKLEHRVKRPFALSYISTYTCQVIIP